VSAAPELSAAERLDLFAIYLNAHGLHHLSFEQAIAIPVVLGCLRNTLEATRRRLAKLKAKAAREAADFALEP
jgi:hypothetical protein